MPIVKREEPVVIYDCGKCGLSWDTFEEYEDHCKADPITHIQDIESAPCLYCQKLVTKIQLPFTKEKEPTPAICDNCFAVVVKPALIATGRLSAEEEKK
jgi:hypothetical protein